MKQRGIVFLCFLYLVSCTKSTTRGPDSETNWLTCKKVEDCRSDRAVACVEPHCVDVNGERISATVVERTDATTDASEAVETDSDIEREDASEAVETDSDIERKTDSSVDTADCQDPCLSDEGEPIESCLSLCGGSVKAECPSDALSCQIVRSEIGICAKPEGLSCEDHETCRCLAPYLNVEAFSSPDLNWICNMEQHVCIPSYTDPYPDDNRRDSETDTAGDTCCTLDLPCESDDLSCIPPSYGSATGTCKPEPEPGTCWTDANCGTHQHCRGAVACGCDDSLCAERIGKCVGIDEVACKTRDDCHFYADCCVTAIAPVDRELAGACPEVSTCFASSGYYMEDKVACIDGWCVLSDFDGNCNQRTAACAYHPPSCPEGFLSAVGSDHCPGPCVDALACKYISP